MISLLETLIKRFTLKIEVIQDCLAKMEILTANVIENKFFLILKIIPLQHNKVRILWNKIKAKCYLIIKKTD